MVTHIVMFKWKAGVTDAQVDTFHDELAKMAGQIPSIMTLEHGPDLRFREGNLDYVLVQTFENRAAWDAYQSDPLHKAFVSNFVAPLMESRVAIQF